MSPPGARGQLKERMHGKADKEKISVILPRICLSLISYNGLRRNLLSDEWLHPVARSVGTEHVSWPSRQELAPEELSWCDQKLRAL